MPISDFTRFGIHNVLERKWKKKEVISKICMTSLIGSFGLSKELQECYHGKGNHLTIICYWKSLNNNLLFSSHDWKLAMPHLLLSLCCLYYFLDALHHIFLSSFYSYRRKQVSSIWPCQYWPWCCCLYFILLFIYIRGTFLVFWKFQINSFRIISMNFFSMYREMRQGTQELRRIARVGRKTKPS